MCLCRCKSSGRLSGLWLSRHEFYLARWLACNLDQAADLLCAQANSASYPHWDRKLVHLQSIGWRPTVADCGGGISVVQIQLFAIAGNRWLHHAPPYYQLMLISCHSETVKRCSSKITKIGWLLTQLLQYTYLRQESCAVAKMTVQCALYMGALKMFMTPWLRPRLLFPTFSWTYVPIHPMNVPSNFEVLSFTHSWDNRGYPKNWAVPGYAHVPFSPKFLMGFYSDWPCKCTRQIWSP